MTVKDQPEAEPELDSQLFASLLTNLTQLYQLTAFGVDASRQLEIARLAGTIRESLEQAKKQAQAIPGADLTLQDQQELIAILEKELAKRQTGQVDTSRSNS